MKICISITQLANLLEVARLQAASPGAGEIVEIEARGFGEGYGTPDRLRFHLQGKKPQDKKQFLGTN